MTYSIWNFVLFWLACDYPNWGGNKLIWIEIYYSVWNFILYCIVCAYSSWEGNELIWNEFIFFWEPLLYKKCLSKLLFSWRRASDFFLDFLRYHPQIINGRPLIWYPCYFMTRQVFSFDIRHDGQTCEPEFLHGGQMEQYLGQACESGGG